MSKDDGLSLTAGDRILFLQILFFIQNIKYSDVFLGAKLSFYYLVFCFGYVTDVTVRSRDKTFATFVEKRYISSGPTFMLSQA